MSRLIYMVAGEVSGDGHGAGVMGALMGMEEGVRFRGLGGVRMVEVGGSEMEDWLGEAAVLGLWEVLKKYEYFKKKMEATVKDIVSVQPDVLVLVDYPGFNLRLAKAIRMACPRLRIVFYVSPQVWAWKKGRVKMMAEVLDVVICLFPFEVPLYEKVGLEAVCAGHPIVDEVAARGEAPERDLDLVALLPGSRVNEVRKLFPAMLEAGMRLREEHGGREWRFVTAAPSEEMAALLREVMEEVTGDAEFCAIAGHAYDAMARAGCGVVASGTASLEAAVFGLPYCLVYKVNALTGFVARRLLKIRFLGMANVLMGREVVKELLQEAATAEGVYGELERLATDEEARAGVVADLELVRRELGDGDAYAKAAASV